MQRPGTWISPGSAVAAGAVPSGGQLLLSQVTLKLLPPLSEETESSSRPALSAMMISVGLKFPMAEPFTVALVKVIGLKWASGRMPPLAVQHGASAMTSAEEFAAPESDLGAVWLP